MSENWTRTRCQ